MSTTQIPRRVHAPVLGTDDVEAKVIDTDIEAGISTGLRCIFRLDVDGCRYWVPEDDCTPI